MDIEFCGTNLTTLPEDLDQKWPSHGLVSFESSGFKSVPDTDAYVAGIFINDSEPDHRTAFRIVYQLFHSQSLVLWESYQSPTKCVQHSRVILLARCQVSQIQALLAWIDETSAAYPILATGGTPLCKEVMGADASALVAVGLSEAQKAYQNHRLICREFSGIDLTNNLYQFEPLLDTAY